jgi:hypothetical protein
MNRADLEDIAQIWERLAKDQFGSTHQARTTALALRQLLDETAWKPIDGKAMSGNPVIIAIIDETGEHEPVIGEARKR